jgi:hypothetical protein
MRKVFTITVLLALSIALTAQPGTPPTRIPWQKAKSKLWK